MGDKEEVDNEITLTNRTLGKTDTLSAVEEKSNGDSSDSSSPSTNRRRRENKNRKRNRIGQFLCRCRCQCCKLCRILSLLRATFNDVHLKLFLRGLTKCFRKH